jgi:hypothetical protein
MSSEVHQTLRPSILQYTSIKNQSLRQNLFRVPVGHVIPDEDGARFKRRLQFRNRAYAASRFSDCAMQ